MTIDFLKISIADGERTWLKEIYDRFKNNEDFEIRNLKAELHGEISPTFNPKEIDERLIKNGKARTLRDCLNIHQSPLSQHSTNLRDLNIVERKRNGVKIKYFVINEEAKKNIKGLFTKDDYFSQKEANYE